MANFQAVSNEVEHLTLHEELCCSDLDSIAVEVLQNYVLPLHDAALLSQERIEGMQSCIRADLDDMVCSVPVSYEGAENRLIPWDASKAHTLTRECVLATCVDIPEQLGEEDRHKLLAGFIWDLMADSFPVWSE